jgi:hypothetical protein
MTEADEQRKRVHKMFDQVALDLVRQERQHLDRRAEHAKLVREARLFRQHGDKAQGR